MELNDSILPSYRSGVLVWGYPAVSPARADHPLPTYCRPQPRRGSNGKNIARGRTEFCPRARVMSPYCGACCDNPTTTTTISSSSPHLRSSGASTAVVQVTQSNIEISQPTSVPHIALSHWYHWKHVNHFVTDTRSSHNIRLSGWRPSGPQPGKCCENNLLLMLWECFDWMEMKIWSVPADFNSI